MREPEFFDVEGIPVSLGNVNGAPSYCSAWDKEPPRPFNPDSARRNGAPVSREKFLELVRELKGQESSKRKLS